MVRRAEDHDGIEDVEHGKEDEHDRHEVVHRPGDDVGDVGGRPDRHVLQCFGEPEPGEGERDERAEDAREDREYRGGGGLGPFDGHGHGDVFLLQLGGGDAEQSDDRQIPVFDDLVGAVDRGVEDRPCECVGDDVEHHDDDGGGRGDRQPLVEDSVELEHHESL